VDIWLGDKYVGKIPGLPKKACMEAKLGQLPQPLTEMNTGNHPGGKG
jgi:hypothetical protein